MALATECKPAVLPLPGGVEGATVRVHPMLTGEMHAPPAWNARPGGRLEPLQLLRQFVGPRGGWEWLPIPAFLVEHPGAGPLLIDTGLHPACVSDVASNMGAVGRFVYRIKMEHDQALRVQLPQRGVEPTQIRVVIMTHLHIDHASAVSEFPAATFVVDAREWEAADEGGAREGYHARQFDHAFDWRSVDYESDPVQSFAGFAQSLDLFGDRSVRLVSTRGHTRGHQSVVLRTAGREVLVMGDAAYTIRSLHGESRPLLVTDGHLYQRSLKEIRRYLEQTPDALAIPGHDPDFWPTLEEVYG